MILFWFRLVAVVFIGRCILDVKESDIDISVIESLIVSIFVI